MAGGLLAPATITSDTSEAVDWGSKKRASSFMFLMFLSFIFISIVCKHVPIHGVRLVKHGWLGHIVQKVNDSAQHVTSNAWAEINICQQTLISYSVAHSSNAICNSSISSVLLSPLLCCVTSLPSISHLRERDWHRFSHIQAREEIIWFQQPSRGIVAQSPIPSSWERNQEYVSEESKCRWKHDCGRSNHRFRCWRRSNHGLRSNPTVSTISGTLTLFWCGIRV